MSSNFYSKARIKSVYGRIVIGEAVGIYFATLIIYSNYLQYTLSKPSSLQTFFGFSFAVGMAIGFGGYIAAFVSPLAPINPSVCAGMSAGGYIKVKFVPLYYLGEFIGTMLGQLSVYGLYYDAIKNYADTYYNGSMYIVPETAFLCTFPPPHTGIGTQIFNVFAITATLAGGVNAVMDKNNFNVPVPLQPILFGFLITIILNAFSYNAGGTMNFFMDLSGRIVLSMFGWGAGPWTYGNFYFWIPIVIGPLGAIFAANIYNVLISPNITKEDAVCETKLPPEEVFTEIDKL